MHRLGTGYTNYYNLKNKRVGCLFQGRFKAQPVNKNRHLLHLPYYIHANPLDLAKGGHGDPIEFLDKYRWSSHMDYCGWANFPRVTLRQFLLDFFGGEEAYRRSLSQWIRDQNANSRLIKEIAIDSAMVLIAAAGILSNFTDIAAGAVC